MSLFLKLSTDTKFIESINEDFHVDDSDDDAIDNDDNSFDDTDTYSEQSIDVELDEIDDDDFDRVLNEEVHGKEGSSAISSKMFAAAKTSEYCLPTADCNMGRKEITEELCMWISSSTCTRCTYEQATIP